MLLHTIINNKINGIIYSSMRKDYDYYNADKNPANCFRNENLVVPAKVALENGNYVDNLLKMMEISQPLNFEHEIIKGTIALKKSEDYNKTIFGQMERLIELTKTCKAARVDMIQLQCMSQRMKDLKNKINIL